MMPGYFSSFNTHSSSSRIYDLLFLALMHQIISDKIEGHLPFAKPLNGLVKTFLDGITFRGIRSDFPFRIVQKLSFVVLKLLMFTNFLKELSS